MSDSVAARTIVVAHGKSEVRLCEAISRREMFEIIPYASEGGERAIKLEHLKDVMSSYPFDSKKSLHRKYADRIHYDSGTSEKIPGLRIFTIMDIDGDYIREKSYTTGNIFRDCPLRDYIVPIYNRQNLEDVLGRCGYPDVGQKKVKSYRRMFMEMDFRDLMSRLSADDGTNMDVFIRYCLEHCPHYQNQLPA